MCDAGMSTERIKKSCFRDRQKPIPFIIGTDWWTDCDDAVAMRVLAWAHISRLIKIKGIVLNACMAQSVRSLDAFMTLEGCPGLPMGIDREAVDFGRTPLYQKRLAYEYPVGPLRENEDCPDGAALYRQILAESDEGLDIIEIGYPQVLSKLLKSPGDHLSPLTGKELVKQKVNKLWLMAGNWNYLEYGLENNFSRNERSREAGHFLCRNWPTPITFLGGETASDILTGDTLTSEKDPVYNALKDHGLCHKGRSSWDPLLAFLACCNNEETAGYSTVRGYADVDAETGANRFKPCDDGSHCFVRKAWPDSCYKQIINAIVEERQAE